MAKEKKENKMQLNKNEQFYFTVSNLIEALKSMPQDLPILVNGYEGGYENFHQPSVMTLKHQPDNPWYDGEFQNVYEEDKDNNVQTFKAVVLQRISRDVR